MLLKSYVVHFIPQFPTPGGPFFLRAFDAQTAQGAQEIADAMASRGHWFTWYIEEVQS